MWWKGVEEVRIELTVFGSQRLVLLYDVYRVGLVVLKGNSSARKVFYGCVFSSDTSCNWGPWSSGVTVNINYFLLCRYTLQDLINLVFKNSLNYF